MKLLLLVSLIFNTLAFAQEENNGNEDTTSSSEKSSEDKKKISHSVAPIAGYNPTYRFFFGGGYFLKSDKLLWSNLVIVTIEDIYRFEHKWDYSPFKGWKIVPEVRLDFGFEPNYGSGNRTTVPARTDTFGRYLGSKIKVERQWNENWSGRLGYHYIQWIRYRTEDSAENNTIPSQILGSALVEVGYDNSYDDANPKGWKAELDTEIGVRQPHFYKSSLSIKTFLGFSESVVLASHSKAGYVFGESTYFSDFKLGGTDTLRGFLKNRHRGEKLYLQQMELRFPIAGPLMGVAFGDLGEATNERFAGPNIAYGAGLRFGLPPDKVKQIRVDVGKSKDQFGVFFDFGHTF